MSYLENLTITIIGHAGDELSKKLADSVTNGGGIFDKNGVTKDTTHAILFGAQNDYLKEIEKAVENGAAVVHPRWLEVCSIHRQKVPVQPFKMMPGPSPLFSDMVFTASGLSRDDKIKLAALVTFHGGKYTRALNQKTTHLVTHKPVGEKYDRALNIESIKKITPGWVLTSAKSRVLKNTTDYDPANVIPGSEHLPDAAKKSTPANSSSTQSSVKPAIQKTPSKTKSRRKRSPNSGTENKKSSSRKTNTKKNSSSAASTPNASGNSGQKMVKVTTPATTITPSNKSAAGPVFTTAPNSTPKSPSVTTTSQSFVHQPLAPPSSSSNHKGQIIAGAPRAHIPQNPTTPTNQPQYIVVSSSSPQISGQIQIAQSSGQIVKSASDQAQIVQSVSPMIQGNTSSPHAQIMNSSHQRVLNVPVQIPVSQTGGHPQSPMFIRPVQAFPGNTIQMVTQNGTQVIHSPIQHQPPQSPQTNQPQQMMQGQMIVNQGQILSQQNIIHQGQPNMISQQVQALPSVQGQHIVVQHHPTPVQSPNTAIPVPGNTQEGVQMISNQQLASPGVKMTHQGAPMMVNQAFAREHIQSVPQYQRQNAMHPNFQNAGMHQPGLQASPRSPQVPSHARRMQKPQMLVPTTCPEEELHSSIKHEHEYFTVKNEAEISPKFLCFIGCVFYFAPDVQKICKSDDYARRFSDWKGKIQLHGGLVEDTYNKVTCTHLVSEDCDTDEVKAALADQKRCVSILWVEWCLEKRKVNPPRCLLHVPTSGTAKTKLKEKFRVSTSNFQPKTKEYVNSGLQRLGIIVTKMLYKETDMLIVPKPIGQKYTTAIYHETPCVSLHWLREALLETSRAFDGGWRDDSYKVMDGSKGFLALCLSDKNEFDAKMLQAWKKPIKIEADFELRAKLKRDYHNLNQNEITSPNGPPEAKKQKITYRMTPRVMLTGFTAQETTELTDKIKAIGGEIASDTNMTHIVAKEFRRTVKWYCAMHIAKYAVTPEWVNESFSSKWFLDEEKFWLSDPRKEQLFNFHIRQSIERAREHRVFNGYRFALLSEKVIPSPEVLEKIIRSGGGRFLTAMPSIKSLLSVKKQREEDPRSCWPVIIIANNDKSSLEQVRLLRESQLQCFSSELILNASVKQRLEFHHFMINPPQLPR